MTDIFWAALAGTLSGGLIAAIGFAIMVWVATKEGPSDTLDTVEYIRNDDGEVIGAKRLKLKFLDGDGGDGDKGAN